MIANDIGASISEAIMNGHFDDLRASLSSDVIIAGAGPSGLAAAIVLASAGRSVTIVEKRLSPGGGIWGGGMTMSKIVVQESAVGLLSEIGVRYQKVEGGLYVADAIEFACMLCAKALQAGARMLNLHVVEDVCLQDGRVTGAVVNKSILGEQFPVDPLVFRAKAIIDATGHEASVVQTLKERGLIQSPEGSQFGEGPMDVEAGEKFVVDEAGVIFPGLYVAGMSVCACFGGPRMGPIFGGMLLSGTKIGELLLSELR